MAVELKLVCLKCEREVTQEMLDAAVFYTFDAKWGTLEIDVPCTCGSKISRVKAEQKAEVLLWPK